MKAVVLAFLVGLMPSYAAALQVVPVTVPTLDDVGLVALISLVGVVGGFIARRRGK